MPAQPYGIRAAANRERAIQRITAHSIAGTPKSQVGVERVGGAEAHAASVRFNSKLDLAVETSKDLARHPTTIEPRATLTQRQALGAAAAHVNQIRRESQARTAATAARTEEVRRLYGSKPNGEGNGNWNEDDHPRDEHGKWTEK